MLPTCPPHFLCLTLRRQILTTPFSRIHFTHELISSYEQHSRCCSCCSTQDPLCFITAFLSASTQMMVMSQLMNQASDVIWKGQILAGEPGNMRCSGRESDSLKQRAARVEPWPGPTWAWLSFPLKTGLIIHLLCSYQSTDWNHEGSAKKAVGLVGKKKFLNCKVFQKTRRLWL